MDVKAVIGKITDLLKKYRYAVLVLFIGLALMMIPTTRNTQEETAVNTETAAETCSLEQRLADLLSQVEGAGKVEVMLTIGSGEETVYQYDENTSISDNADTVQRDVVTVTDSQRNETGLVRQVNPAVYMGAIVVCEGADDPAVVLDLVNAVSKVTGLGANRISVLKMK